MEELTDLCLEGERGGKFEGVVFVISKDKIRNVEVCQLMV